MAARNRKTRLATLEKTYPSPATLPDLQAPGQKSRSKDSMSEIDSMTMSAPWTRVNFGGAETNQKRLGRKEPNNDHYRCDYHPGFQQIAYMDTETGELQERALQHREEAEKFYRELAAQGLKVRVGMEASGHARWFERLLAELNVELWIGDAAEIRRKRERKQKTDRQDAQHILRLLLKDDFPRIWVPSWENRDLRQLLWHRHRMVQARTRMMNQLQAVAQNEGRRCKKKLWREAGGKQLEAFRLAPWASRRRH